MAQDLMTSDGDALIPMSPLDAVMSTYRVLVLYIYPPQAQSESYDLQKLRQSFVTLVNEDYAILVGELYTDKSSGAVSVKQTAAARQQGGDGIRFESSPKSLQTSEEAKDSKSWDFMPHTRVAGEIIAVKVSLLADGGLAIGVDCSHILFDGESMITFMKAWGQHYSGIDKNSRLQINHDRNLLFGSEQQCRQPHPEFQTNPAKPLVRQADGSLAPKAAAKPPPTAQHVFRLSKANMAALKKVVTAFLKQQELDTSPESDRSELLLSEERLPLFTTNEMPYVSTLDVVTALFTILISRARGHGNDVRVSTAVNGRRRLQPPLPDNFAGNAVFHAISAHSNTELQAENGWLSPSLLASVALRVRRSILERDDAFMRDTIAFLGQQSNPTTINDNVDFFFGPDIAFTCWANMGLYDAEFDGTRPSYASIPRVQCMDGFVLITEASNGLDGLHALVCLESSTMEKMKELSADVPYFHM